MSYLEEWKNQGIWLSKMTEQAAWGLTDQIHALGENIQGAEIGVQHGANSLMLLDACPNIKKIYGIDPYEAYDDWDKTILQPAQDLNYSLFQKHVHLLGNRFELIKSKSQDAAKKFQDESLDFVFIDGDHSIRAVLNDLALYTPKIKKGGILAGHDVGLHSVTTAIQSWARYNQVGLDKIKLSENTAWYWVKE